MMTEHHAQELLTLADVARGCGVSAETVLGLIAEGLLEPRVTRERELRFTCDDLIRVRCALRIQRDLGVNRAGAALAIDLVEEIERLRSHVRLLERLAFRR